MASSLVDATQLSIPRSRSVSRRMLPIGCIFAADLGALMLSLLLAVLLKTITDQHFSLSDIMSFIGIVPVFLVFIAANGLYPGIMLHPVDEMKKLCSAITVALFVILATTFFRKQSAGYSREVFGLVWI